MARAALRSRRAPFKAALTSSKLCKQRQTRSTDAPSPSVRSNARGKFKRGSHQLPQCRGILVGRTTCTLTRGNAVSNGRGSEQVVGVVECKTFRSAVLRPSKV